MRIARNLLLWLAPAIVLSCSALIPFDKEPEVVKQPPRPTVNHAVHIAAELECADCHDPDETGDPKLPAAETCFECHENLAEENERVQAYFTASKEKDGSYRFDRPALWPDLIMDHKSHAKNEVSCAGCHGEPAETAFPRPDPVEFMDTCMTCHTSKKAPNSCKDCHQNTRKEKKPPDHNAEAFMRIHGSKAPKDWKKGQGENCAFCHQVPSSCDLCHETTKPETHRPEAFQWNHGLEISDIAAGLYDETSCALCHKEDSCVRCHQWKRPRSHTTVFTKRTHGIWATLERQSCQTCHKQDTCVQCHQTAQPINHRGTWGSGQQTHCIACHEPLQSTGCFVCHKDTLGHLQSPPRPADGNHLGASDPIDCENCHVTLPHFNDGGRCARCHR
ncbi:MAG: cytochrome c3 family protein [Planctomycetota bacterium]|jgi:hypothetical protein